MRSAKVYRRNGVWIFHTDCKTTAGVWVAAAPFLRSDGDPAELGECLVQVLNSSVEGIPHPTQWSNLFNPVLELAGVKSWNAFVKGAMLVGIESDTNDITLTPHRTLSPKEGFEPIHDCSVSLLADAAASKLGTALSEVFGHCSS